MNQVFYKVKNFGIKIKVHKYKTYQEFNGFFHLFIHFYTLLHIHKEAKLKMEDILNKATFSFFYTTNKQIEIQSYLISLKVKFKSRQ